MHCHRANWSWRLWTTKTNHCRRSRSSPTTTRASIENSCPAGQGFSVPQCAGTLRKGQARKMGLCAGCGALAQAPFLGQLAAKRCRARARFLGLPVLAAVLRIDLAGSDTASACGLVVRGRSPVTKLCRHLVAAAGCDPAEPAETLSRRDPVRKQNVLCPPQ